MTSDPYRYCDVFEIVCVDLRHLEARAASALEEMFPRRREGNA